MQGDFVETPFRDMLPSSIKDDPKFVAASQTLDGLFAELNEQKDAVLIWSRVNELEEPLLSNLAFQLHLDGYEGWNMAESLDQKRALVRNAIMLHWHKGTRWSLERIFEILDMRGQVYEWFEDDAPLLDDVQMNPYEFDLDLEVTRPIDEKFYDDVFRTTDALKNVRSWLRRLRLLLTSRGQTPRIALAVYGGAEGKLFPPIVRDIEMRESVPKIGIGYQAIHYLVLYPAFSRDAYFTLADNSIQPRASIDGFVPHELFDLTESGISLKGNAQTTLPGLFGITKTGLSINGVI